MPLRLFFSLCELFMNRTRPILRMRAGAFFERKAKSLQYSV